MVIQPLFSCHLSFKHEYQHSSMPNNYLGFFWAAKKWFEKHACPKEPHTISPGATKTMFNRSVDDVVKCCEKRNLAYLIEYLDFHLNLID